MKKIVPVVIMLLVLAACNDKVSDGSKVRISTKYGDITLKLYDETPQHRDNFIKLAKEGFYNDLLFHRVIDGFMIQGGDPDSKGAEPGKQLGAGGPGYKVPAEFIYPKYFHKKGALAAARQGDQANPKKESSGSQFYIVQGKPFSPDELKQMAVRQNDKKRQAIFYKVLPQYQDTLQAVQSSGDPMALKDIQDFIMAKVDEEFLKEAPFTFTKEQMELYTTVGGAPFLDGDYTVFGEVTEGLAVLDSIAKVEVDANNRPVEDVVMQVEVLE